MAEKDPVDVSAVPQIGKAPEGQLWWKFPSHPPGLP